MKNIPYFLPVVHKNLLLEPGLQFILAQISSRHNNEFIDVIFIRILIKAIVICYY